MALFKKKREAPVNPYYDEMNLQPTEQKADGAAASGVQTQAPANPMPAENGAVKKSTEIPLIPLPNIKVPDINLQPTRSAGISVLDALRMESNSKSIAFIKMSDFKKVLDDIKDLERRVMLSQADLESYSRSLDTQREYVKNYNVLIQDMHKMIERMSAYLSNVEE